jgi:hypothetical protein
MVMQSDDTWEWKRVRGAPRWWAYLSELVTTARQASGLADHTRQRAKAVGLEARPPLFDPDLIETVLRIDPRLAFDKRHDRAVARAAMRGRVSDDSRQKSGKRSLAPFYHTSLLADFDVIRRLLGDPGAEVRRYADAADLADMLERPREPGKPGATRWVSGIWALLTVELWLRAERDRDFAGDLLESGTLSNGRVGDAIGAESR